MKIVIRFLISFGEYIVGGEINMSNCPYKTDCGWCAKFDVACDEVIKMSDQQENFADNCINPRLETTDKWLDMN